MPSKVRTRAEKNTSIFLVIFRLKRTSTKPSFCVKEKLTFFYDNSPTINISITCKCEEDIATGQVPGKNDLLFFRAK